MSDATIDTLKTRLELDPGNLNTDLRKAQATINSFSKKVRDDLKAAEDKVNSLTKATKKLRAAEKNSESSKGTLISARNRVEKTKESLEITRKQIRNAKTEEDKNTLKNRRAYLKNALKAQTHDLNAALIGKTTTTKTLSGAKQKFITAQTQRAMAQNKMPMLQQMQVYLSEQQAVLDGLKEKINLSKLKEKVKPEKKELTEDEEVEKKVSRKRRSARVNSRVDEIFNKEKREKNEKQFYSGPVGWLRKKIGMKPTKSYLNLDETEGVGGAVTRGMASLGLDAEIAELGGPIGALIGGVLALGDVIKTSIKVTSMLVKQLNNIWYSSIESGESSTNLLAEGQISEQWGGTAEGARQSAVNLARSLYALKTGGGVSSELRAMAMYGVYPVGPDGRKLPMTDIYQQQAQAMQNRPWFSRSDKYNALRQMGDDKGWAHLIAYGSPRQVAQAIKEQMEETKRLGPVTKEAAQTTRRWAQATQVWSNLWDENVTPIFLAISDFIANISLYSGKAIEALEHPISSGEQLGKDVYRDIFGGSKHASAVSATKAIAVRGQGFNTTPPAIPQFSQILSGPHRYAAYQLASGHVALPKPIPQSAITDQSLNLEGGVHIVTSSMNNVDDFVRSLKSNLSRKQNIAQADGGV